MIGTVGIVTPHDLQNLKQYALIFDNLFISDPFRTVYFIGTDSSNKWRNLSLENSPSCDELDWLCERGVIVDTHEFDKIIRKGINDNPNGSFQKDAQKACDLFLNIAEWGDSADRSRRLVAAHIARRDAAVLQLEGIPAITVASDVDCVIMNKSNSRKEQVLSLILRQLPAPSDVTSWQDLLDFRLDNDSRNSFLRLRQWITKVANQSNPLQEVVEELEYLMSEYEQHLHLHKIKTTKSVLEVICVSVATVVEDLAKFKLRDLAKDLFEFRQRRITLLEAESSAPGREIAYIHKVNQVFK